MENREITPKKKCPYCGEEIQPDAVKCKHCGEWLTKESAPVPPLTEDQPPIENKSSAPEPDTPAPHRRRIKPVALWAGLIAVVAIAAIALAPSEGQHRERIEKAAIACIEKKISSSLGAVGGSALSPISSIAFNVELVQQKIRERLEQENRIEVENRVFWSQARIYNQLHPYGKMVSFGCFGFVFPSIEWEDIALLSQAEREDISRFLNPPSAQAEQPLTPPATAQAPTGTTGIRQLYHGVIEGDIDGKNRIDTLRCEFDLFFEDRVNEEGKLIVNGTYKYPRYGGRAITLSGTYDPNTDLLVLVEYYKSGKPNCTMRVQRTSYGFDGMFIRKNGQTLSLTMTQ